VACDIQKVQYTWADIQQTRASDDEVVREIKIVEPGNSIAMSGFKLRITAAV
jgi:hypothetical protein